MHTADGCIHSVTKTRTTTRRNPTLLGHKGPTVTLDYDF